jgi:hypothetical protein
MGLINYWRRVPLLAILPCMMMSLETTEAELEDDAGRHCYKMQVDYTLIDTVS